MEHTLRRQRIVCIVGPTACHKTELSIELAKCCSGEIVSADSVQVYLGMDIGSAKPPLAERQGVAHHLIDCLPIETPEFSAAQFREMATEAIAEIAARGNTPIIVGGSGLYVNALTYPLGFAIPRNEAARERASLEYDQDPDAAFARLRTRVDHLELSKRTDRTTPTTPLDYIGTDEKSNSFRFREICEDIPCKFICTGRVTGH